MPAERKGSYNSVKKQLKSNKLLEYLRTTFLIVSECTYFDTTNTIIKDSLDARKVT